MLTEKYRPTSIEDFIGDKGVLNELEEYVSSVYPVILVGPPGIGKTCGTYIVAKKLGLNVIKSNASDERTKKDLVRLRSNLSIQGFKSSLYLLDEVDGVKNQDFLASIVSGANKPIVMTANNKQNLSKNLKKASKVLVMKPPSIPEVVNLIRLIAEKEGITITDYSKVTGDVRASINNVFNGGSNYKQDLNDFEKVEQIFKQGKLIDISPVWLMDNVHNFYTGRNMLEAIEVICAYAIVGRVEVLSSLPKSTFGKSSYPYIYRRYR